METDFGCRTPFGSTNKTNLCGNSTLRAEMAKRKFLYEDSCLFPCDYLGNIDLSERASDSSNPGKIKLRFKRYIQKFQTRNTYSLVDLFAALGGYLGSFLGVSLFHLKDGLAYLIRKFLHK